MLYYGTGQVKSVYPGLKKPCLLKSLAQWLRVMLRTYWRKSQLTTTSHPSTSTKWLRIWRRDTYEQHFTIKPIPITVGRGNSFVRPIQSVLLQRTNSSEGQGSLVELGQKNTIWDWFVHAIIERVHQMTCSNGHPIISLRELCTEQSHLAFGKTHQVWSGGKKIIY